MAKLSRNINCFTKMAAYGKKMEVLCLLRPVHCLIWFVMLMSAVAGSILWSVYIMWGEKYWYNFGVRVGGRVVQLVLQYGCDNRF